VHDADQDLRRPFYDGIARRQDAGIRGWAMSVSIRVIDSVYGKSAIGISACLSRELGGVSTEEWRDQTDDDGRISSLNRPPLPRGSYTLEFDLDGYFRTLGFAPSNSAITLRFYMPSENHHYGLALLVTPSSCITFKED
jgi:5-hydroxyisourate hydrolase-like protein (transthyretin family)